MKFLIDQQLPPALARWLIDRGCEAVHVRELGLRRAPDRDIWRLALDETMILVTKDEDFAKHHASRADGPTILWLRIGNATNEVLFDWLAARWPNIEEAIRDDAGLIEVR